MNFCRSTGIPLMTAFGSAATAGGGIATAAVAAVAAVAAAAAACVFEYCDRRPPIGHCFDGGIRRIGSFASCNVRMGAGVQQRSIPIVQQCWAGSNCCRSVAQNAASAVG